MNPKRILVVFPFELGDYPFSGGIFKATVNLLKALDMENNKIELLLPINNRGIVDYLQKHFPKVQLISMNFDVPRRYSDARNFHRLVLFVNSIVRYFSALPKIKTLFSNHYDVVYFQEVINWPFFKLAYKKSKKTILHVHGYRFTESPILVKLLRSKVNKFIDVVISPTISISKVFDNVPGTKCYVVRTPFSSKDVSLEADNLTKLVSSIKNKKDLTFGFAGRINRIKRIDHFIKAIAKLEKGVKDGCTFLIAGRVNNPGDKQYEKELKTLTRKLGLENNVKFIGYVSNIEDFLQQIDFGVLLSESEALSMAGLEFVFHIKPLISYDAPGNNELIENQKGGLLVKNGDIEELSKAIRELFVNIELRESLLRSCVERQKLFSFNTFRESISNIINN